MGTDGGNGDRRIVCVSFDLCIFFSEKGIKKQTKIGYFFILKIIRKKHHTSG